MIHGTHNALPDPRNENILVYINGELYPRAEAKISVFDSAFLVGDGVWEAMRLYDGVLVFLDKHLDRLFQGAKAVGMDIGLTRAELTAGIVAGNQGQRDENRCPRPAYDQPWSQKDAVTRSPTRDRRANNRHHGRA